MKRLRKIIADLHPEFEFTGEEKLIDSGILDSFDIVTLVTDVNEEYGISIPAEEICKENFDTEKNIAALIERCGGDIGCS